MKANGWVSKCAGMKGSLKIKNAETHDLVLH